MSELKINRNANSITFTDNNISFSQFGIAKEILDLIENQQQEIERLNKKIKQYEDPEDMTLMFMWCDEKAKDEIKRLNNIINEFDKWLENEIKFQEIVENAHFLRKARIKLQELKGSNEPSFEEMVGFVENVYKDIKSQSTLHEELEEERKTIAKIVGDFKEVNK